jgi:hypothetical protein
VRGEGGRANTTQGEGGKTETQAPATVRKCVLVEALPGQAGRGEGGAAQSPSSGNGS